MVSKYTVFNYTPEMYEKDKEFVDSIHLKVPYLGRNRPQDAFELAKILRSCWGYKGLRVGPDNSLGAFVPLDRLININPWRIVRVSNDMYVQSNKRLHKFGDPLKNPESPFYKKSPDLEGRIEEDGQMLLF